MKSIPIEGYGGLKIADSGGSAQIQFSCKEITGSSSAKVLSLSKALGLDKPIPFSGFELTSETVAAALKFRSTFGAEKWIRHLPDARRSKVLETKKAYESEMKGFKLEAQMAAYAEVDKDFA